MLSSIGYFEVATCKIHAAPNKGEVFTTSYYLLSGRRGDLMVSALDSGSGGPGSSPGQPGHCVVFLGKKLYSHSASLYPGV